MARAEDMERRCGNCKWCKASWASSSSLNLDVRLWCRKWKNLVGMYNVCPRFRKGDPFLELMSEDPEVFRREREGRA